MNRTDADLPRTAAARAPLRRGDIARTTDYRQTSNDSAVLRAVLDHGPVARSTVARLAGLSPAAVSRLSAELIAAGLVRENLQAAGPRTVGRPHVPIDIDTSRLLACGLHIAIPHATLSILDLRGRVLARERLPHQDTGAAAILARVARRIPGFLAQHTGGRAVVGLGVATGGWVDQADGVIVDQPLLGWRHVPASQLLSDAIGLPVRVDNHARAVISAEQLYGDPRTRASAVHLLVGNVIDAAFTTGGAIHHGPQSAAGAVAHLPLPGRDERCRCGRRGCLQAVISSRELGVRAARDGITPRPDFNATLAAARRGDRRAAELFRERARLLGAAAALLLDMLNPEVLVVTEQGIRHLPECLELVRAQVRARSRLGADPGRAVVAASFGDDALAIAAGAVILAPLFTDPLGRRVVSQAS